ncbi:prepilin peptidase [Candidatus Gottesmanbacteria bacterium]|nr:prepilin peptidase [Candidatus Gottesmanbacteria bacterium]
MWLAGLFGLCIGSFLNVLIDRLPKGQSVVYGRSHCDHCKKTLRWYELIPIVSFVIQLARCRRCHKKLSLQYPAIELLTGVGFALLFFYFADSITKLSAYVLIFCSLIVIFFADLKYQIIPDSMVVVGIIGVGLLGSVFDVRHAQVFWISAFGASVFFLLLWLLTGGRGMGLGDVKLVFLLGLLLGYPGIVVALYAAFLTGAGVGVILMKARHKTWKSRVAFGPFLILGTVITILWKTQILAWWGNIL